MSFISNGDICDEDMADITDWTDSDSGTGDSSQVTFDNKSCMKLLTGISAGTSERRRDVGTFGNRVVVSLNLYCDLIGTSGDGAYFQLELFTATKYIPISFCSNGLFISSTEVGTDIVIQDSWQEWTFDVNWAALTLDVYLNQSLVASNVSCNLDQSMFSNGTVRLYQENGNGNTPNTLSYIDWFKAGSDFASDGTQGIGGFL